MFRRWKLFRRRRQLHSALRTAAAREDRLVSEALDDYVRDAFRTTSASGSASSSASASRARCSVRRLPLDDARWPLAGPSDDARSFTVLFRHSSPVTVYTLLTEEGEQAAAPSPLCDCSDRSRCTHTLSGGTEDNSREEEQMNPNDKAIQVTSSYWMAEPMPHTQRKESPTPPQDSSATDIHESKSMVEERRDSPGTNDNTSVNKLVSGKDETPPSESDVVSREQQQSKLSIREERENRSLTREISRRDALDSRDMVEERRTSSSPMNGTVSRELQESKQSVKEKTESRSLTDDTSKKDVRSQDVVEERRTSPPPIGVTEVPAKEDKAVQVSRADFEGSASSQTESQDQPGSSLADATAQTDAPVTQTVVRVLPGPAGTHTIIIEPAGSYADVSSSGSETSQKDQQLKDTAVQVERSELAAAGEAPRGQRSLNRQAVDRRSRSRVLLDLSQSGRNVRVQVAPPADKTAAKASRSRDVGGPSSTSLEDKSPGSVRWSEWDDQHSPWATSDKYVIRETNEESRPSDTSYPRATSSTQEFDRRQADESFVAESASGVVLTPPPASPLPASPLPQSSTSSVEAEEAVEEPAPRRQTSRRGSKTYARPQPRRHDCLGSPPRK